MGNLLNGAPKDRAIAIGYFAALIYTLTFVFILRNITQPFLRSFSRPQLLFVTIGSLGAIFVETVIWSAQTQLHTSGIAIHPNLLIDLIMTMPFYILLCYLLSKIVLNYSFSWPSIALAGGFYELIADGVVGNLFQLNITGVLISPLFLPIFIVFYSPIVLVPFLALRKNLNAAKIAQNKYLPLVKPIKAALILPFSIGVGFLVAQILK